MQANVQTHSPATGFSIVNKEDYALKRLAPALDEALKLQAEFVELPLYALDVIGNGRVLPLRLKQVKAITSARPLRYTVHGPGGLNFFRDTVPLQRMKDVFRACLEVTAELGAINFVMHTGICEEAERGHAEKLFARQRDALAEAGDIAEALGVTIAVENIYAGTPGRFTALPSRLAAELAAIAHPAVRACLDFSHAVINANLQGADPMAEAAALAPLAKECHVHDSFGQLTYFGTNHRAERMAFGEGDLHMPPGMGSIPWDTLMERCTFAEGTVFILELPPHYWADLPKALDAVRSIAAKARVTAGAAAGGKAAEAEALV